jgi:hypothetical protein
MAAVYRTLFIANLPRPAEVLVEGEFRLTEEGHA